MTDNDRQLFLSRIVSEWTARIRPAQGEGSAALQARNDLLIRYHEAIYRFLHARLPNDPNAANEIFSRFADALLEGEAFLKQASQERGRFCHYLKRVLSNRINDYYREKGKGLEAESDPGLGPGPQPDPGPAIWRQELMNQAWAALQEYEQRTGRPFYTVCHIHHSRPTLRSPQKAEEASKLLGRPITAENFRKLVQRGEEQLADLVIREVVRSLRPFFGEEAPPPEVVEEELAEFGLLAFCREALKGYAERGPESQ